MAIIYQGDNQYKRAECGQARFKVRTEDGLIDIASLCSYDTDYMDSYSVEIYLYLPADVLSVDVHITGELYDTDDHTTTIDKSLTDVQEGWIARFETEGGCALPSCELELVISPRGSDASKYKSGSLSIRG